MRFSIVLTPIVAITALVAPALAVPQESCRQMYQLCLGTLQNVSESTWAEHAFNISPECTLMAICYSYGSNLDIAYVQYVHKAKWPNSTEPLPTSLTTERLAQAVRVSSRVNVPFSHH
jgi:hypothetical protein